MYEKDSGQLAAFAKFGDARLSKRFGKIVQVLTESPGKTIPQAFDAAGVKATYRFFASDIAVQSIFDAQAELTVSQLRPGDVVLNIQDTTSLDFSSLEQTPLSHSSLSQSKSFQPLT